MKEYKTLEEFIEALQRDGFVRSPTMRAWIKQGEPSLFTDVLLYRLFK